MANRVSRLSTFARRANALLESDNPFDWRLLDRLYPAPCALLSKPELDAAGGVSVEVRYLDPSDDPEAQPVLVFERAGADEPGAVSVIASSVDARGRRSATERRRIQAQADRLFEGCAVHTFVSLDARHRPGSSCCASLDGKAEQSAARGKPVGEAEWHPLLVLFAKKAELTLGGLRRLLAPLSVELPGVPAPPPSYYPALVRVTSPSISGARRGLRLHALSNWSGAGGFMIERTPHTSPELLAEVVEKLATKFRRGFSGEVTVANAEARSDWRTWVQKQPQWKPKNEQSRVELLYELRERVGDLTRR